MKAHTIGIALAAAIIPAGSTEIVMTPESALDLTTDIQAAGFMCPLVKSAFAKESDAEREVLKVFCGPTNSSGVYQNAVYRITTGPDGDAKIEPWD